MRSLGAFLVVVNIAFGSALSAATGHSPTNVPGIRLVFAAKLMAGSPTPPEGHWVLRPEGEGDPIRVELRPGIASAIELELGRRWEIGLEAEGFWAARRVLMIEAPLAGQPVTLEVWPLGVVAGELRLGDRRDKLPVSLEVAVLRSAEKRGEGPNGRSGCDLRPKDPETVSFICRLPATRLDLSFQPAGGFAPAYLRGVEVSAAKVRRIEQPFILKKGGSVAGWVQAEGGSGLVPGLCFVRIEPALGPPGGGPRLGLSLQSTGLESSIGLDGSFELTALAPGVYRLRVEQVGYSPFVSGPVRVLAGIQTLLQEAVVLHAPVDLEVAIRPESDPQGQPWKLTLIRREGQSYGPAFEGMSDEQGVVWAKSLDATTYSATVSDATGNDYWSDPQFHVGGLGEEKRQILLDLWSVQGTVRQAGEPLDAVLLFGGKHGAEQVQMESSEGRFFGALPHLGRWRVEVEWGTPRRTSTVAVQVKGVGERRGEVEIQVPANRAFGRVVSPEGRSVEGAEVLVENLNGALITSTDQQGSFELFGLPEGRTTFVASLGERNDRMSSPLIERSVAAEEPTGPIVLALRRTDSWSGQIQSEHGPVVGATVHLFSTKPGPDLGDTARSDLDGGFAAHLPSGVTEAVVIALAPGYGLRGIRQERPGGIVNLSVAQGTLSVHLPADHEEYLERGERLAISQDGLFLPVTTLLSWSMQQGTSFAKYPAPLVFRGLSPGNYRACFAAALDIALLNAGLVAPRDCVTGSLTAGGVLKLEMNQN